MCDVKSDCSVCARCVALCMRRSCQFADHSHTTQRRTAVSQGRQRATVKEARATVSDATKHTAMVVAATVGPNRRNRAVQLCGLNSSVLPRSVPVSRCCRCCCCCCCCRCCCCCSAAFRRLGPNNPQHAVVVFCAKFASNDAQRASTPCPGDVQAGRVKRTESDRTQT